MKKIILSTLIVIFCLETKSQTQFKIQDPVVASGVSELKKTEFYTKQLKELGFTDKDVTIKTFPIRKFYSDAAGALTRSLVEADRAEFFIEATTKKMQQV
ncbi:MAG: hypothetical protein IPJ32_17915 [Sphingobacteriaceae bacterium]|nr:hypothetical protein [Sphingobacteriaceae bacterium]